MYSKNIRNNESIFLNSLANVYRNYNATNWIYRHTTDQIGDFVIDGCIESSAKLKIIAKIIGKGLLEDNSDAKIASLLFQKLYRDGFAEGLYKEKIQNNFKEILPAESINRLNNGTSMADCMKSICIYEDLMSNSIASMKQ